MKEINYHTFTIDDTESPRHDGFFNESEDAHNYIEGKSYNLGYKVKNVIVKTYWNFKYTDRHCVNHYSKNKFKERVCRSYIYKYDINGFKQISNSEFKVLGIFDIGRVITYQNGDESYYTDKEGLKFLEDFKKDHQAYVSKGTDWPYFFKVGNKYLKSNTCSWGKHLYDRYGIISDCLIEAYHGPDKESEHLKNCRTKDSADSRTV